MVAMVAEVSFVVAWSHAGHASHARDTGFKAGFATSAHVFGAHVPTPRMASSPAARYVPAAHASHPSVPDLKKFS